MDKERIRELRDAAVDILGILQEKAEQIEAGGVKGRTRPTERGGETLTATSPGPLNNLDRDTKFNAYIEGYPESAKMALTPSPAPTDEERRAMVLWLEKFYDAWYYETNGDQAVEPNVTALRAYRSIRSRLTAPPLLAKGDAHPKPTVTREWIEKYFFEGGLVDTAVALLRAVGITVEEEK